jgi:hypothetical protein
MNIPRTTFRDQEGWGAGMLTKVSMGPSNTIRRGNAFIFAL